jgi:hypothetical protein
MKFNSERSLMLFREPQKGRQELTIDFLSSASNTLCGLRKKHDGGAIDA